MPFLEFSQLFICILFLNTEGICKPYNQIPKASENLTCSSLVFS
jgi:hypothetical protein